MMNRAEVWASVGCFHSIRGLLALLEDLQVRGVSRVVARLGIDFVNRVIDSHGRLGEAGSDQLQLALVGYNVARGVYTGQVCFHPLVDHDRVPLEFETPIFERTEVWLEADESNHRVDFEGGFLIRLIVEDGYTAHTDIAVDAANLAMRQQFDATTVDRGQHFLHRLCVGPEAVAPVNQNQPAGPVFQGIDPIHG